VSTPPPTATPVVQEAVPDWASRSPMANWVPGTIVAVEPGPAAPVAPVAPVVPVEPSGPRGPAPPCGPCRPRLPFLPRLPRASVSERSPQERDPRGRQRPQLHPAARCLILARAILRSCDRFQPISPFVRPSPQRARRDAMTTPVYCGVASPEGAGGSLYIHFSVHVIGNCRTTRYPGLTRPGPFFTRSRRSSWLPRVIGARCGLTIRR
jgi:hypothetical protein